MKKMIALTCIFAAVAATATLPTIEGADATASGFTAVSLAADVKTMIAIPYQAFGGEGSIAVKDLVSAQNLTTAASATAADTAARLYVLTAAAAAPQYNVYYLNETTGWAKTDESQPDPATLTVSAGDAFFLVNPTAVTAYTKGCLVSTAQNTTCSQGYNLVSAVSTEAYNLGSLTFTTPTGAAKAKNADKIILQDGTIYWYKTGSGWYLNGAQVSLDTITIDAGKGFWYYNVSSTPVVITSKAN